jgi:hypothetical protein
MQEKLLYTIGNLYGGAPFGVEAERQFGTVDIYGPFTGENDANTFAHRLVEDGAERPADGPYKSVKVVQLQTPQAGRRIVRNNGAYEYAV